MRPKAKYAVIHRHRGEYPISVMCKFFGVSRSGYYCFKKRLGETDRDAVVAKEIEDVIGLEAHDAPRISAKTGLNVEEVLEQIVTKIPAPHGDVDAPLKALIFDSI